MCSSHISCARRGRAGQDLGQAARCSGCPMSRTASSLGGRRSPPPRHSISRTRPYAATSSAALRCLIPEDLVLSLSSSGLASGSSRHARAHRGPPSSWPRSSGRCDHCTCAPPRSNSTCRNCTWTLGRSSGTVAAELYDLLRSEAARVASGCASMTCASSGRSGRQSPAAASGCQPDATHSGGVGGRQRHRTAS